MSAHTITLTDTAAMRWASCAQCAWRAGNRHVDAGDLARAVAEHVTGRTIPTAPAVGVTPRRERAGSTQHPTEGA